MKIIMIILASIVAQTFVPVEPITVTPDGLKYGDQKYTIIEVADTTSDLFAKIEYALNTKHPSPTLRVEKSLGNQLIVTDRVAGFTKSDRSIAYGFLFDLSYKLVIEIESGKIRINTPTISISQDQLYEQQINHYYLSMGFSGDSNLLSNAEKKLFIYNEDGTLIEKSTKSKLELLFNNINQIIIDSIN